MLINRQRESRGASKNLITIVNSNSCLEGDSVLSGYEGLCNMQPGTQQDFTGMLRPKSKLLPFYILLGVVNGKIRDSQRHRDLA